MFVRVNTELDELEDDLDNTSTVGSSVSSELEVENQKLKQENIMLLEKLKELEQKLSSRDTDENVQPSAGQSAIDTPPPSAKKRPAIGNLVKADTIFQIFELRFTFCRVQRFPRWGSAQY